MITLRGFPTKRTQSSMNTAETVFDERSDNTVQAQNLVKKHTVIKAGIDGEILRMRHPTKGYTTSNPAISPLNFATQGEISGGVTRLAFQAHEHCVSMRVIISSETTTFAACNMLRIANSLQRPM